MVRSTVGDKVAHIMAVSSIIADDNFHENEKEVFSYICQTWVVSNPSAKKINLN